MNLIDALLPEFEQEMKTTRRVLERVPWEQSDWTPHPKSRTLHQLATHVADIPLMATRILGAAEWDAASPRPERAPITTTAELLGAFDQHVGDVRTQLAGKTDGELTATWTFKHGGREMFALPKMAAIRRLCLSHLIHHRGQLTVYLRLRDVALPSVYGPTADEGV
ncbi:MAG TPA: DinB family protein [Vicinamibacteria bacterium]|jgi:uncharacterized damage-inducible protein DinB